MPGDKKKPDEGEIPDLTKELNDALERIALEKGTTAAQIIKGSIDLIDFAARCKNEPGPTRH